MNPAVRKRSRAGVTLIEVLIAITLLSMLTLGMLFAMRIGLTTFAKTDTKLMINRRVAGSQRIIQQELEGLMPVSIRSCGKTVLPKPMLPLFQGQQQSMRLVSLFSLQQAWRGQPQILDLFVIQADDGPGVRLVVNETPYTPGTVNQGCLAIGVDPISGLSAARFAQPQASKNSFVLADRLSYCRFFYLAKPKPQAQASVWMNTAPGSNWPEAIRIEMAPVERDPSQIQPVTVTAPIFVHRGPDVDYDDR